MGSITDGVLALAWKDLEFDAHGISLAFKDVITKPIRLLADQTIDIGAVIADSLPPIRRHP